MNHYTCSKYPGEEALFYCDDCNAFIGAKNFALNCRNCNCSTPELMKVSLDNDMLSLINNLKSLKENVDGKLSLISELNNFFSSKTEEVNKHLSSFNQEIATEMNKKSKELNGEIQEIFNGVDSEVENSSQRLNLMKKRADKIMEEVKEICNKADSIESDEQLCVYKKKKEGYLKENKKFLTEIQSFSTENVQNTKEKTEAGMDQFNSKSVIFQKNADIYENSILNTINSGIPNQCMRIRRFRRFFFSSSRYLKTTSINFRVSHSVNLVGFCLCGLFNNNIGSNASTDFDIKIYEMNSNQIFNPKEKNNLLWESIITVPTITNVVDPVFQFYLNKTIQVNKEKSYIMIMNNMAKNSYIDMWTGEIIPEKSDMIEAQTVTCNNSGVKFTITRPKGIQSDFDEFSNGIVSDVIFSHLD